MHGTVTALAKVINDLTTCIDQGKVTFLISLDLSKAFDTISHFLLLAKLKYYGCDPKMLRWFFNFLCNRVQHVKANNKISNGLDVIKGVPQGTRLGPCLFSIFASDVAYYFSMGARYHVFADDIQFSVPFEPLDINFATEKVNHNLSCVLK